MQDLLNVFKALSEETRLRIVKLLEHGELCVCDIVAALDMIQPKVSFHLAVLKDAVFLKTGNRANGLITVLLIMICSEGFCCCQLWRGFPLKPYLRILGD